MNHVNERRRVEDVDDLKIPALGRLAPDSPFAFANRLRPWAASTAYHILRFGRDDLMFVKVLDVPFVPAEDVIHAVYYTQVTRPYLPIIQPICGQAASAHSLFS